MRMRKRTLRVLLAAGILAILSSGEGTAATPTETVRGMLEDVMVIQAGTTESRSARSAEIRRVIAESFDLDDMARQTLGPHWESLDERKRTEFKSVFQDLFLDSYTRLVLDFLKKERITYRGEDKGPNGETTVKTVIERTSEQIPVDYNLFPRTGRWHVRDVLVDDVSIVGNYRKSFARVIKQESYEGLLRKMKLQQQAAAKP
jgi:phospholipid transport system substrate-binding protein